MRRPRVRGLDERFASRLRPAFQRRTEEVGRLLPDLYLHGLAQGDFELALRGLLGDGAPAVIWKTLLIAEKTFRRLDEPELLADVASGVVYITGVRPVNRRTEGVAA